MGQEELFASMEQELRRGTLVLCVLCQLEWPMYGYSLVGALSKKGVPVEANTLYPAAAAAGGAGAAHERVGDGRQQAAQVLPGHARGAGGLRAPEGGLAGDCGERAAGDGNRVGGEDG